MKHILPTTYDPRLTSTPIPLSTPADPGAALALAATLDRQADLQLSEGRTAHADRLSHLAFDVRCRAMGGQA